MSKDKFIEFCIEYVPYKECVERYYQGIDKGEIITIFVLLLLIGGLVIWGNLNR